MKKPGARNNYRLSLLMAIIILCFIGCKKAQNHEIALTENKRIESIPPFLFDWETATYAPTSPANVVTMPWQGVIGGINGNIADDYHKVDGWELVYSTFNYSASPYLNQTPPGGLYFTLYNKYRGLLRFYLYIPSGTSIPSAAIAHGLSLYPQGNTTSSILNFAGNDVIDVTSNLSGVMKTNNQQINLLGNWIAMQYEIAYDPNMVNTSYPNLGLQWTAQSVNITNISLAGTQTGTINGQITTPSSGFSFDNLFGNISKGSLEIFGLSDINAMKATAAPNSVQATLLNSLSTTITGFANNAVSGIFSSIFGKNGTKQTVTLDLSTKISITGTSTNSTGLTNPFFAMPGQSNSQIANGPIPNYNSPMGVFNLSGQPQITYGFTRQVIVKPPREGGGTDVYTNYLITKPDFSSLVLYNPAVINQAIATAQIIQQDLIFIPDEGAWGYFSGVTGGTTENINNQTVYVNPTGFKFHGGGMGAHRLGIRYTIRITPANGAPVSNIVKTFLIKETVVAP